MNNMFAVVIVDYGTLSRTAQYIKDFIRSSNKNVVFIIVDVFDKNKEILANEREIDYKIVILDGVKYKIMVRYINDKEVYQIYVNENVGFARGNNIGALLAQNLKVDYIIFSNNDIKFPFGIDLSLLENIFYERKKCFLIGPKVIGIDGIQQGPFEKGGVISYLFLQNADVRLMTIIKYLLKKYFNYKENIKAGKIYAVQGCFMITKASRFFEIGMFDEKTFLYREEEILSERAARKGYYCYFFPDIKVVHEGEGTINRNIISIAKKDLLFKSASYYFVTYRHTDKYVIKLANYVFYHAYVPLYSAVYPIWIRIKNI